LWRVIYYTISDILPGIVSKQASAEQNIFTDFPLTITRQNSSKKRNPILPKKKTSIQH
jgi:hypothetical protein